MAFKDLIKEQRNSGKNLAESLGTAAMMAMKEKIDPRNKLFAKGTVLNALFPKVKGYKASQQIKGTEKDTDKPERIEQIKRLDEISQKLDIIGKNTLVLPMMYRDTNVMRQSLVKLVKLVGGNQRDKADRFFLSASERESLYESQFGRSRKQTSPEKVRDKEKDKEEKKGFLSKLFGMNLKDMFASLVSGLIKGGLIVGVLELLGKYFLDPDFRKHANKVVDDFMSGIFGDSWGKQLLVGVGALAAMIGAAKGAIAIFKYAVIMAAKQIGEALGFPIPGMPGGTPNVPGKKGPKGKVPKSKMPKGKTPRLGGRFGSLLNLGTMGLFAGEMMSGDESEEFSPTETPGETTGVPGVTQETSKKTDWGNVAGSAVTGAVGAAGAVSASKSIMERGTAKTGVTGYNSKAGRFVGANGKFTSAKNLPAGDMLKKFITLAEKVAAKKWMPKLIGKLGVRLGTAIATKAAVFIGGLFVPGAGWLASGISLALLGMDAYLIYDAIFGQNGILDELENEDTNPPKAPEAPKATETPPAPVEAPKTTAQSSQPTQMPSSLDKASNFAGDVLSGEYGVSKWGWNSVQPVKNQVAGSASVYPSGPGASSAGEGSSGGKPTPSMPTGPNVPAGGTGNSKEAMDFFMRKGWTKEQAAGIVGNLMVESGNFAPSVVTGRRKGDGGKAVGIAQWWPDRQAKFQRLYGKPLEGSSFKEQLEFINWELNNSEYNAGMALRGAKTAEEAAAIVDKKYERSSGAALLQRQKNAVQLAGGKFTEPSKDLGAPTQEKKGGSDGGMPNAEELTGMFGAEAGGAEMQQMMPKMMGALFGEGGGTGVERAQNLFGGSKLFQGMQGAFGASMSSMGIDVSDVGFPVSSPAASAPAAAPAAPAATTPAAPKGKTPAAPKKKAPAAPTSTPQYDEMGNVIGYFDATPSSSASPSPLKKTIKQSDQWEEIAGERVVPGQPLSPKQMAVIKMSKASGNSYSPAIEAQYAKQLSGSGGKSTPTAQSKKSNKGGQEDFFADDWVTKEEPGFGNGTHIAGEKVVSGQPLSAKQLAAIKMAKSMGNSYSPEIEAQYKKQNSGNITPQSKNGVVPGAMLNQVSNENAAAKSMQQPVVIDNSAKSAPSKTAGSGGDSHNQNSKNVAVAYDNELFSSMIMRSIA